MSSVVWSGSLHHRHEWMTAQMERGPGQRAPFDPFSRVPCNRLQSAWRFQCLTEAKQLRSDTAPWLRRMALTNCPS